MLGEMPELEIDGGTLHYEAIGPATGDPVTLLHGFTQTSRSWRELLALLPKEFRYLVPDLRGHGATKLKPRAPHTMAACTADLLSLWAREGVTKTHLVGYSMGGRLALQVATAHPDRLLSLTTIGAHAGMAEELRAARRASDEQLAAKIEQRGVAEFVKYWGTLPLFKGLDRRGPAFRASLDADRRRNTAAGLAASLRGMGSGVAEPVWDALPRVTCPCLFIAGAEDHGYAHEARRLAASVTDGAAEIVPRAGHAAQLERPDAVARLLSAHLRGAAQASRAVRTPSPSPPSA
jgi:2-succinyl-6-hydroxy-2,4-cyclohexadiene-1-carboxylate synthase